MLVSSHWICAIFEITDRTIVQSHIKGTPLALFYETAERQTALGGVTHYRHKATELFCLVYFTTLCRVLRLLTSVAWETSGRLFPFSVLVYDAVYLRLYCVDDRMICEWWIVKNLEGSGQGLRIYSYMSAIYIYLSMWNWTCFINMCNSAYRKTRMHNSCELKKLSIKRKHGTELLFSSQRIKLYLWCLYIKKQF
jgi:hypothetical protein